MPEPIRVQSGVYAMGTRFELVLYGEDEESLGTVGEEVWREIRRLDAQLSFYRDDSDTTDLNIRAAHKPVVVEPRLFALLARARELSEWSEGAFDITVAPLIQCWGFVGATGQMPTEEAISQAQERVGMRHVVLNAEDYTVAFDREGVLLDFGAIGKGYAIERAVELLREYEIPSALLHGGTSTIYALGAPPEDDAWKIAIQRPFDPDPNHHIAYANLRDAALSVSAPHGKWFESEGRKYGHVLDPRTGYPTSRSLLAALILESATESDALSTALLTLGADWLPALAALRPDSSALVAFEGEDGALQVKARGAAWTQ